jgi:ubiquinone/menaquinone biosynthesis C-methylase UbiE
MIIAQERDRGGTVSTSFAPGLHIAAGRPADITAYDRYIGRWSRLFASAVVAAAEVVPGSQVLDVSTGTGEAALPALATAGGGGLVVGLDIAPAMLIGARQRLNDPSFCAVAADGQALPFDNASFDAVLCQLGLQFFPNPARGLTEFRRVLQDRRRAAVCVVSAPERAPMWGVLAAALARYLPAQRELLHLTFSLAETDRLQSMFASAGFRDVRVERLRREDTIGSFDEYWDPIEAGMGSMPQAYKALPEAERRAVRAEVKARLSPSGSDRPLTMSLEVLIATGSA